MGLRWSDDASERIAQDLYAFLEPHSTTDQAFDDWCGWVPGSTRELLEKRRKPTHCEIVEICMRLGHPLAYYVVVVDADGSDNSGARDPGRCTVQTPCCPHRLRFDPRPGGVPTFDCPRSCTCHD
jgi:hypothetical protein